VRADRVVVAPIQVTREASNDSNPWDATWRKVADTHNRIIEAVRHQAGVLDAGGSNFLPLQVGWRNAFAVEGEPPPARREDAPQAQLHSVSEGWFATMGARLLQGRDVRPGDGPEAPGVVVVNETFARRYLAGGPAVGRHLRSYAGNIGPLGSNLKFDRAAGHREHGVPFEVIGIVADIRNAPLGQPVEPAIWFTTRQFPFGELQVAVRAVDAATAVAALRAAVREAAPAVPIGETKTWGERLAQQTAEPRLLMSTLIFFGLLASLLAAIGVYGIFSWSVALRTRELAIRLTLGALPASIGRIVAGHTAALLAIGLFAGLVLVRLVESTLARVLYQVSPHDLGATLAAGALLLAAAVVACVAPALRALRVDPVIGLRAE
jgi:putative ABC transport system permease protein